MTSRGFAAFMSSHLYSMSSHLDTKDSPRTVVARRLERDAVRDFEVAEPFEQLRVAHGVLEGDEHGRPSSAGRIEANAVSVA